MDLSGFVPYITVVVAARNDIRGGNVPGRLQTFLRAWLGQAKRYNLPSEIIVVEWNPPADRAKLIDSLEWPMDTGPCEVRFVEVPREVHQQYPNPRAIPLHQTVAKNVGIRRSRGEFVLATNIDSVFSTELMQFLSERRLEGRTLYRMDRHDVRNDIPAQATADELVAFCQDNILRVHTPEGTFEIADDGLRRLEENDIVAPDEGIRFGAGWYPVESGADEGAAFRWMGSTAELIFQRPPGSEPGLLMDAEVGPSAAGGMVRIEVVDPGGSVLASATFQGRSKLRLAIPDQISSGSLRFRLEGGSIPLVNDARFLKLRVFGLRWECSPWSPQPLNAEVANAERQASVRIRSMEPRQIQLALRAGEAASLDSLGVRLTDRKGNVLFQVASDGLPPAPSGEYLVALDLGFKFSGHDGTVAGLPEGERPAAWFLEVVATRPSTNWSATNHTPNRFADQMRTAEYLHTTACDDFMLLSREDWSALRGYAEFPIWPKHIDSLFCYSAHHAGMRELVLKEPLRIFHIEHHAGAGGNPADEPEGLSRREGVRIISDSEMRDWIEYMHRFNVPVIFTRSNWGLADLDFKEVTLAGGSGFLNQHDPGSGR